jgi:NAD(P)-dependent dehydrogenase (short-subunit alcohol dehydrogenase family)
MDTSNGDHVKTMVKSATGRFGRVNVLVNVAAIVTKSAIEDVSDHDWDRVTAVNLKGTFLS